MSETVGFIGLGVMGRPMAKHILAKGYGVAAYNRSRPAVVSNASWPSSMA